MGGGSKASRAAPSAADDPLPDPARARRSRAPRLGRMAASRIGRQRAPARRAAARSDAWDARARAVRAGDRRRPAGSARTARTAHQRLARTHRTGINRTAGNRTRRPRRHPGRGGAGAPGMHGGRVELAPPDRAAAEPPAAPRADRPRFGLAGGRSGCLHRPAVVSSRVSRCGCRGVRAWPGWPVGRERVPPRARPECGESAGAAPESLGAETAERPASDSAMPARDSRDVARGTVRRGRRSRRRVTSERLPLDRAPARNEAVWAARESVPAAAAADRAWRGIGMPRGAGGGKGGAIGCPGPDGAVRPDANGGRTGAADGVPEQLRAPLRVSFGASTGGAGVAATGGGAGTSAGAGSLSRSRRRAPRVQDRDRGAFARARLGLRHRRFPSPERRRS